MVLDENTPLFIEIAAYLVFLAVAVFLWLVFGWWERVWRDHLVSRAGGRPMHAPSRGDEVIGTVRLVQATMLVSKVALVATFLVLTVRLLGKILR